MKSKIKYVLNKWKISVSGFWLVGLIFIIGCGTPQRTLSEPQNFQELQELVNTREFAIQFQWAQPQGGGMIDLMSNPNHIKFNGEEVDIFLPYFGVRHSGGGYGNNTGGIKYEGEISKLKISEDPSKQSILMEFEGRQGTEFLLFDVTLYENGKAYATVSSSERANIVYHGGDVKPTAQDTDK